MYIQGQTIRAIEKNLLEIRHHLSVRGITCTEDELYTLSSRKDENGVKLTEVHFGEKEDTFVFFFRHTGTLYDVERHFLYKGNVMSVSVKFIGQPGKCFGLTGLPTELMAAEEREILRRQEADRIHSSEEEKR